MYGWTLNQLVSFPRVFIHDSEYSSYRCFSGSQTTICIGLDHMAFSSARVAILIFTGLDHCPLIKWVMSRFSVKIHHRPASLFYVLQTVGPHQRLGYIQMWSLVFEYRLEPWRLMIVPQLRNHWCVTNDTVIYTICYCFPIRIDTIPSSIINV